MHHLCSRCPTSGIDTPLMRHGAPLGSMVHHSVVRCATWNTTQTSMSFDPKNRTNHFRFLFKQISFQSISMYALKINVNWEVHFWLFRTISNPIHFDPSEHKCFIEFNFCFNPFVAIDLTNTSEYICLKFQFWLSIHNTLQCQNQFWLTKHPDLTLTTHTCFDFKNQQLITKNLC